jgi:uncharacterized protein
MMINIDWAKLENLVRTAVNQIRKDAWDPTMVLALSRGGFVPATMIAHQLGVRHLGGLPIAKNVDGERSLAPSLQLGDLDGQRVLIVDDGIISGKLLAMTSDKVRSLGGEPRTCALISLGRCSDPDYLVETHNAMPSFPWE